MREEEIVEALNRELFFLKDAVKRSEAKFSDKLDVYDPDSRTVIMECREPNLNWLVKIMRLFGGDHDRGTPFDMVATIAGSSQQAIRVKRGSATFTMTGGKAEIFDYRGENIGTLKKLAMALGTKFEFKERATRDGFVLEMKTTLLGAIEDVFFEGKKVASFKCDVNAAQAEFYKAEKFAYAFWISPEVEKKSRLRQVLLAFALARRRLLSR
jgi:hypothetical protein